MVRIRTYSLMRKYLSLRQFLFYAINNDGCVCHKVWMCFILWISVWRLFHINLEFWALFLHNNNYSCKLFAEIYVLKPHMTLWHSLIIQTYRVIRYLVTALLKLYCHIYIILQVNPHYILVAAYRDIVH